MGWAMTTDADVREIQRENAKHQNRNRTKHRALESKLDRTTAGEHVIY